MDHGSSQTRHIRTDRDGRVIVVVVVVVVIVVVVVMIVDTVTSFDNLETKAPRITKGARDR